jgi:hypothetical protein
MRRCEGRGEQKDESVDSLPEWGAAVLRPYKEWGELAVVCFLGMPLGWQS